MTGILNTLVNEFLLRIILLILHYIVSAIIGILGTIVISISNMLFKTVIINGGILDFNNIVSGISNIFGAININIETIIYSIALFTMFLTILASGIKMMTSTLNGKETDSPIQFIVRLITATFLLASFSYFTTGFAQICNGLLTHASTSSFFGLSEDSFAGGISTFLALFSYNDIASFTDVSVVALIKYIANDVITIIFIFTLFKDTFAVALTFVERIIQFAVYMLLGPICIAFYPYKETSNIMKEWFMGVLSQTLVIFLSCMLFNCYFAQMQYMGQTKPSAVQSISDFFDTGIDITTDNTETSNNDNSTKNNSTSDSTNSKTDGNKDKTNDKNKPANADTK